MIFPLYEHVQHGELYNSAAILGPDGDVVGLYRKNSIPLAHTAAMPGFEKFYFRPGNLGFPVFETNLGIRIGIVICYERHFPEGPRALALQGADVLFVPTSTGAEQELWEARLRSHAAANMLWVAGVNRVEDRHRRRHREVLRDLDGLRPERVSRRVRRRHRRRDRLRRSTRPRPSVSGRPSAGSGTVDRTSYGILTQP